MLFTHVDTTVSYTQRQLHKDNALNSEEIDELRYFYSSMNEKKGSYTGIARDMNIIVVQAESMQGFLIGEEINWTRNYNEHTFHAFEEDFWNRHEMYASLGFDRYIDSTYYEMDEYVGWMGQALSDASFFRQSLDMINTTSKFYASFITLSCHYPYSYFTEFPVGRIW